MTNSVACRPECRYTENKHKYQTIFIFFIKIIRKTYPNANFLPFYPLTAFTPLWVNLTLIICLDQISSKKL